MVSLRFSKDIGIDLGTTNTIISIKNKGIIINEPSVVAFNTLTEELVSVGTKAAEMIGRTPPHILAINPIKEGIIDDFETTKMMLRYFITEALKGLTINKPKVIISVPMGLTQVEKRAVIEAAKQAGAQKVSLINEPVAAAIGADLPVEEPRGNMLVNIGGGISEVAIISLGGIVIGKSLRSGGSTLNQAIMRGIRKLYNLDIGDRTAEIMKQEIGYAIAPPPQKKYLLKGKNLTTGLPTIIEIKAHEITELLLEPLHPLLEAIHSTLERTPPELASDILKMGITLTGGGALLKNIDQFIATTCKIPIHLAEDPLNCVARGIGKILEDIQLYEKLIKN